MNEQAAKTLETNPPEVTASDGEVLRLVSLMTERGLTLCTCESLTAGLLSARIADVPGASVVLRGGLVTYAMDLKTSLANVSAEHLAESGPVNHRTAREMAIGALERCGSDLAVSTTGVAGPGPHNGVAAGTFFVGLAWHVAGVVESSSQELLVPFANRTAVRMAASAAGVRSVLDFLIDSGVHIEPAKC